MIRDAMWGKGAIVGVGIMEAKIAASLQDASDAMWHVFLRNMQS